MNKIQEATNRKRNRVEERGSFEKFVVGVTVFNTASWRTLKSSMLFWRSRMLRKKSLDISAAGLIIRGGASGGPLIE